MKYIIILLWVMAGGITSAVAQAFGLEYTTEGQYGFNTKRANWMNLLRVDLELPIYKNGLVSIATIHTYKLKDYNVADDFLTFSNIEEETNPFAIALMGYTQKFKNQSLFLGVRNMNEDYFTTPLTSFFTNSSCGIFPTISINYPIANYPLSSMCIYYEYNNGYWGIKTSIYNGKGYNKWKKSDNPFLIKPREDGFLFLTEFNYKTHHGIYSSGISLHNRLFLYNENESSTKISTSEEISTSCKEETLGVKNKVSSTLWFYCEHHLYQNRNDKVSGIIQYTRNTNKKNFCKSYVGVGAVWCHVDKKNCTHSLGGISSIANFNDENVKEEFIVEISYSYEFSKFKIQPAFHLIKNNTPIQSELILRLCFKI